MNSTFMQRKQKIAIDQDSFECIHAGNGSPAIVLVNGAGGPLEAWMRIVEPLSTMRTVFAYNRLGVAGSSKPKTIQTGSVMVDSLRKLLQHANIQPPYLLVGHSLGGLIVNLFARIFPTEVAGVILLESAAPEDVHAMQQFQNTVQRTLQRVLDRLIPKDPLAETEHVQTTVNAIALAGEFPNIPLRVITGTKPAMAWATPNAALRARTDHQKALVQLSPQGTHILATRSGHFPQFSEPELVIQTVRNLVDDIKKTIQ